MVTTTIREGVGEIEFFNAKANSLTLDGLEMLTAHVNAAAANPEIAVIVIRSSGDKSFCGGASFEDLQSITDLPQATRFFTGFASVILAIRDCQKFVIAAVQGRAVGGGVGLIAACDYAIAAQAAQVRLSEFELGIGPFTVAPAIERKVGTAALAAMTIDGAWRDADWCIDHGLFARAVAGKVQLDEEVAAFANTLAQRSPDATRELKKALIAGTEHWPALLTERARISAELWLQKKGG